MAVFQAASMRSWTEKQKRNGGLIVRQSIQDVSELAQLPKAKGGRMPVDNGYLRNSYTAGLNGSTGLSGPVIYEAVIAGMKMGDTFTAGWKEPYALRQERGFVGTDALGRYYNTPGNFFMETALMDWADINARNAKKVVG